MVAHKILAGVLVDVGGKRVRNMQRNPMVAMVDRYDEDWTRLGWVMLRGRAEILRATTAVAPSPQ